LCSRHHHMVHEGRWSIHRNTDLDPGDPRHITLLAPPPAQSAERDREGTGT
jgi:hypothetical protein